MSAFKGVNKMSDELLHKLYDRMDNELSVLRGEVLYLTKCNEDLSKQLEHRDNQVKSLFDALRDREKALEILQRVTSKEELKDFLDGYAHAMT